MAGARLKLWAGLKKVKLTELVCCFTFWLRASPRKLTYDLDKLLVSRFKCALNTINYFGKIVCHIVT